MDTRHSHSASDAYLVLSWSPCRQASHGDNVGAGTFFQYLSIAFVGVTLGNIWPTFAHFYPPYFSVLEVDVWTAVHCIVHTVGGGPLDGMLKI